MGGLGGLYDDFKNNFKLYFMCIGVKVSDPLELELETVVNCHKDFKVQQDKMSRGTASTCPQSSCFTSVIPSETLEIQIQM
ncbi:hypothetical protein STEG23_038121 [Scotinomys teguina]